MCSNIKLRFLFFGLFQSCESAWERAGDVYSLPSEGSDPVFAGPEARYVVTAEAASARCAVPADFNGDGNLDVVSASSGDSTIAWYARLSDGSYGPKQIISRASNGARIVTTGDVDNDNKTDVVVASYYDHTVGWFRNLGGSFGPMNVITRSAISAQGVSLADVDNDGDLDVLVASSGDHTVAWFENIGEGKFCEVKHVVDNQAKGVRTVIAADLNDDGFLDLAAAIKDDNTIAWYRNDGSNRFQKIVIDDRAAGAYSLVAKDVDGDGQVDLVTASNMEGFLRQNGEGGLVSLYRNAAINCIGCRGNFQKIAVTAGNSTGQNDFDWFVLSVWAGDLDGDGDVDIASASFSLLHQGGISWYENSDGFGNTWTRHRIYTSPTPKAGHHVFGADMDGDGDTDLLAVTNTDNKVHILYANASCDRSVTTPTAACCTAANQYWNGSFCVSCKHGTFVARHEYSRPACQPCPNSCSRPGLAFIPATCHSIVTSCSHARMVAAAARCDCGKNKYLSEYSTCVTCPEGQGTDDGTTRRIADHATAKKILEDGTEYYIVQAWSGFDRQRCKVIEQGNAGLLEVVIATSLAVTVCLAVVCGCLCCLIRTVIDCPSNPSTKTGRWVLKCAGSYAQARLPKTRKHSISSMMGTPRWIINASPFEIELMKTQSRFSQRSSDEEPTPSERIDASRKGNIVLAPYAFRQNRTKFAKRPFRVCVRSLHSESDWTFLSQELLAQVAPDEWRQKASELDCCWPDAIHYKFPTVRKKLPLSPQGESKGELKLTVAKDGSLLFTWSPPHTLRGIPISRFIDFLQEVIDFPKTWQDCMDTDEKGQQLVVDKPPGSSKRNMYDARTHIVFPRAAQVDASYAELFADYGPATLFVSHVWAEYASETLSAMLKLSQWIGRNSCTFENDGTVSRTNVWFCTLCNNQSRVIEELGTDVQFSPFAQVITSHACKYVAMVSPFRALSRKWCNYEFCLAHSQDKSVAMLTSDGVVQAGHVPPKKLVKLSEQVMRFQSRNSTCTSPTDSEFIDNAIQSMGGYEETDDMLRTLFYNVISEAHENLGKSLANMSAHQHLRRSQRKQTHLDQVPTYCTTLSV